MLAIGLRILYWHSEITGAIEGLRKRGDDFNAQLVLSGAGSRSIPYLIEELSPPIDKRWAIVITHELTFLVDRLEESGFFEGRPDPRIPRVIDDDPQEEIVQKCETIQSWWRDHQHEYPPLWQFWSGRKLGALRK